MNASAGERGAGDEADGQGDWPLKIRPEGIASARKRGVECKCGGKGSG